MSNLGGVEEVHGALEHPRAGLVDLAVPVPIAHRPEQVVLRASKGLSKVARARPDRSAAKTTAPSLRPVRCSEEACAGGAAAHSRPLPLLILSPALTPFAP